MIEFQYNTLESLSDDGLLQVMFLKSLPSLKHLKLATEAVPMEDEFPFGKATGRRYSVQCAVLYLRFLDWTCYVG